MRAQVHIPRAPRLHFSTPSKGNGVDHEAVRDERVRRLEEQVRETDQKLDRIEAMLRRLADGN